MTALFPKGMRRATQSKLQDITLRDFGGGLDAVHNDSAMPANFSVTLNNMRRTASGGQKVRFGTKWFTDYRGTVSGDIVDMRYFANSIVAVTDAGEIVAVDNNGGKAAIFNETIANALPGAPTGWTAVGVDSIDFVPFKSELIIHNGLDKPLTVSAALEVTYLQDLATGSNIFVPIGKYGCVVSNYHCVAGIPGSPTLIYISSVGTAGTFPGAPIPNDSISIDVGAYAPQGAPEIRGIAGYRANLIVFFLQQALIVKLGNYNDAGTHIPQFPDTVQNYGILGHRCRAQVENDILFGGLNGMNSAKRNLFIDVVDSTTLGDVIEPLYRTSTSTLTNSEQLKNCFIVRDDLEHETIVHLPTLEGDAFVYSSNEKLRYRGWSTATGSTWRCGCNSFLGRVFYGLGTRIYQQGNRVFDGEDYHRDKIYDRDVNWSTVTLFTVNQLVYDNVADVVYKCIVQHISGNGTFAQDRAAQEPNPKWELYEGLPITFIMELPWIDSREPMRVKHNKFVSIGTKGAAEFTLSLYVDNLYKDENSVVRFGPAITAAFIGNDAFGHGYDAGPYGSGRRSNDPRLFGFPVKFKTLKPIFSGEATKALEIVSLSFLFAKGKYKR